MLLTAKLYILICVCNNV